MRTLFFLFVLLYSSTSFCQVEDQQLISSFKQGARGNCAAIAVIKASLNVYGLDQLFEQEWQGNDRIKVTLKNGAIVFLDRTELIQAKDSAGFVLLDKTSTSSQDILDYSTLSYAVMAKYKQVQEKIETFEMALHQLGNGTYTPTVYKYLGFELGKHVIRLRRLGGKNAQGIVAWSPGHAVFASKGKIDYYGKARNLWFKYSGRFKIIS